MKNISKRYEDFRKSMLLVGHVTINHIIRQKRGLIFIIILYRIQKLLKNNTFMLC
jgi:hypothetical protein